MTTVKFKVTSPILIVKKCASFLNLLSNIIPMIFLCIIYIYIIIFVNEYDISIERINYLITIVFISYLIPFNAIFLAKEDIKKISEVENDFTISSITFLYN